MWIMLNDAFFSIVNKDCKPGHLLVRARRPGDIEKVFGRRHEVKRSLDSDYLFRAEVPAGEISDVLTVELGRVDYANFKNSVRAADLKQAYHGVWDCMAKVQSPPPYSQPARKAYDTSDWHSNPLRTVTANGHPTIASKKGKRK